MRHKLELFLVRYLRYRGWIVFWLDEPARHCSASIAEPRLVCWLDTYIQSEYHEKSLLKRK